MKPKTPELKSANHITVLSRGARGLCPACGIGRIFQGWLALNENCPTCKQPFQKGSGDTWALLYLSTAGLTGVLVIFMLVINPFSILANRAVLAVAAFTLIVASLPLRKGLAVAIDHLIDDTVLEQGCDRERPDPER